MTTLSRVALTVAAVLVSTAALAAHGRMRTFPFG
jgi:hypothetical protein